MSKKEQVEAVVLGLVVSNRRPMTTQQLDQGLSLLLLLTLADISSFRLPNHRGKKSDPSAERARLWTPNAVVRRRKLLARL